jgi:hypothetical protein
MAGEKRLGRRRALMIVRDEIEAYSFAECVEAWQVVHSEKLHHMLLDWQLGVMQNLVFGQVIVGEPQVIPGLPKTFSPYGALKRVER